jgi:hypothetical protein
MTGELVSATHLVMVMANASNWADLFDDSERDALRLVVTEVTHAQAIIAEKDRQIAELAAKMEKAVALLYKAYELVNDGSMQSSQWEAFKKVCAGISLLNQLDPAVILAARDKALTEPLEARIAELEAQVKACHMERDNLKGNLTDLAAYREKVRIEFANQLLDPASREGA